MDVAFSSREVERGESLLRVRSSIGSGFDEQAHHIRMPLRGGPHQCVLILRRLPGVDVGAARDQRAHRIDVACAGAGHDRRLAGGDGCVRVRAGAEQELHERGASVGAGARQRRHTEVVRDVGVGVPADQQISGDRVVPVCGPQKRGGAIVRADVDVGLASEQGANPRRVLIPGRVDEAEIIGRGRGSGDGQRCDQAHRGDDNPFLSGAHPRSFHARRARSSGHSAASHVGP